MLMTQPSCSHGALAWVPEATHIIVGLLVFSSCWQGHWWCRGDGGWNCWCLSANPDGGVRLGWWLLFSSSLCTHSKKKLPVSLQNALHKALKWLVFLSLGSLAHTSLILGVVVGGRASVVAGAASRSPSRNASCTWRRLAGRSGLGSGR